MTLFTLEGMKKALSYIQNNSTGIKYHQFEPRKGLISLPKDMSEEDAYHLFLIQHADPKIIDRFGPDLTMLSIHGQELADILEDNLYIESLRLRLKNIGYSEPSDRQIYRLLRSKMGEYANYTSTPIERVISAISDYADNASLASKAIGIDEKVVTPELPMVKTPGKESKKKAQDISEA